MHPKCNPFSFHPYLGKYSDGVIHPGIAGGELNLNKEGEIQHTIKFQKLQ